jgi:hypothetical protein
MKILRTSFGLIKNAKVIQVKIRRRRIAGSGFEFGGSSF